MEVLGVPPQVARLPIHKRCFSLLMTETSTGMMTSIDGPYVILPFFSPCLAASALAAKHPETSQETHDADGGGNACGSPDSHDHFHRAAQHHDLHNHHIDDEHHHYRCLLTEEEKPRKQWPLSDHLRKNHQVLSQ